MGWDGMEWTGGRVQAGFRVGWGRAGKNRAGHSRACFSGAQGGVQASNRSCPAPSPARPCCHPAASLLPPRCLCPSRSHLWTAGGAAGGPCMLPSARWHPTRPSCLPRSCATWRWHWAPPASSTHLPCWVSGGGKGARPGSLMHAWRLPGACVLVPWQLAACCFCACAGGWASKHNSTWLATAGEGLVLRRLPARLPPVASRLAAC